MNKKYIDYIFAELRKKNYVTTSELKDLTLNYKDIQDFINKGYLVRVAKGYYKTKISGKDFSVKDSTLKKAKEAIRNKNYDMALQIMTNYPFKNNSSKANYIMFQIFLLKKDYIKAKLFLLKSIELDNNIDENKKLNLSMLESLLETEAIIKKLTLNWNAPFRVDIK